MNILLFNKPEPFNQLPRSASCSHLKNDRIWEGFSDVFILPQKKIQQIIVQEHLTVNSALASLPLPFTSRASPPPIFIITHHHFYVSIPIFQSFNRRAMRMLDHFQCFQG